MSPLLASLPIGLLVFVVAWGRLQRRSTQQVVARIERFTAEATAADALHGRDDRASLLQRLARPVMGISETFLAGSRLFERIRQRAEQAAIAVRPAELFAAMLAMAAVGCVAGLMLASPAAYFLLPPLLGALPYAWLARRARTRCRAFEDQLPDVLQGISASLRAGHSFNQAIHAMTKDVPSPTSEEFSRVLAEARLGSPIEVALEQMAQRMGSTDFDFAVTTVNIQRSVGGSLADILQMVGDTVRSRQQFGKKVKALTSMGQMSAYVLLGMPLFMGLVITLMNPSYMRPMYSTTIGHLLLAAGAASMALGYVACMKIVKVKV